MSATQQYEQVAEKEQYSALETAANAMHVALEDKIASFYDRVAAGKSIEEGRIDIVETEDGVTARLIAEEYLGRNGDDTREHRKIPLDDDGWYDDLQTYASLTAAAEAFNDEPVQTDGEHAQLPTYCQITADDEDDDLLVSIPVY